MTKEDDVKTKSLILVAALIVGSGCGINKDVHNAVLTDLENTKLQLADTQREKEESEANLTAQIADLEGRITARETEKAALEEELAQARANLSMYEDKTGGLEKALAATKVELDELRKQKVLQEKRLAEYRKLTEQLASMVKTGKLQVKIRNGNMVLQLSNNILFESGKTEVKKEGQEALTELAAVLTTIANRRFLVAGHTDNVPISSSKFKSNWELSTGRAVNVVTYLQNAGVAPTVLAAAGYGEFDPVGDNATEEGKAMNRRIEIILQPNLDELPKLPKELLEG
jgi:chemotaxis protein MotB